MAQDPQREAMEALFRLGRAQQFRTERNDVFIASALRRIAATDEQSLWGIARGQGIPFVDAVANVGFLIEAGLIEPGTGRMPDMMRLTPAGRSLMLSLGATVDPRAGVPKAGTEPHSAVPVSHWTALELLRTAQPEPVESDVWRRVVECLFDYSDQPLYSLKKRTGSSLLEVCSVLSGLASQDLVTVVESQHGARARLTDSGRSLGKVLRRLAQSDREVA